MSSLAEQYNSCVTDARQQSPQRRGFNGLKRLASCSNFLRQIGLSHSPAELGRARAFPLFLGRSPTFLTNKWHKPDVRQVLAFVFVLRNPGDPNQFLHAGILSDRDDQTPTDLKLLLQRLRDLRPASGDNDPVIGRMLWPSLGPITMKHMDVMVSEIMKPGCRLLGKLADAFDRVDLARDLREDGGGITRASPYL